MKKYYIYLFLGISFILFTLCINIKNNYKVEKIFMDISSFPSRIVTFSSEIKMSEDMTTSKIKALNDEIKELKNLLNLNEITSTYKIINATVINRSMKNYYNTFIIDKGYKNGVDIGDTVITGDGLVGKIEKISNYTSTVKMITSSNLYNMMSVEIETNKGKVYGVLSSYDYQSNSFLIEGIDELNKIEEGSLVTTTGLGENFPSGIMVGKVVRISKDNYDLAYILQVESSVNFNEFHYVAVLDRTSD